MKEQDSGKPRESIRPGRRLVAISILAFSLSAGLFAPKTVAVFFDAVGGVGSAAWNFFRTTNDESLFHNSLGTYCDAVEKGDRNMLMLDGGVYDPGDDVARAICRDDYVTYTESDPILKRYNDSKNPKVRSRR